MAGAGGREEVVGKLLPTIPAGGPERVSSNCSNRNCTESRWWEEKSSGIAKTAR